MVYAKVLSRTCKQKPIVYIFYHTNNFSLRSYMDRDKKTRAYIYINIT